MAPDAIAAPMLPRRPPGSPPRTQRGHAVRPQPPALSEVASPMSSPSRSPSPSRAVGRMRSKARVRIMESLPSYPGESITTVVRLRPRSDFERDKDGELLPCVRIEPPSTVVLTDPQPGSRAPDMVARSFQCDIALDSSDPSAPDCADQREVYRNIGEHLVEHVLQGYNCCLCGYGQTGTGKTYTLHGDWGDANQRGLMPRVAAGILSRAQALRDGGAEVSVLASCVEIYNNRLSDLLAPAAPNRAPASRRQERLEIHTHPAVGVYVTNLSEIEVHSLKEAARLVSIADKLRRTAATSMNQRSSRSHSIFSFRVEVRAAPDDGPRMASVQFADLAGRENEQTSETTGERFRELTFINRSLFHLANCVHALTDGSREHVPFRNSKLTMLLSESFQRNSRTYLLATLTPSAKSYEDNLLTCRFLESTGRITTQPIINRFCAADLSAQLEDEIDAMRQQLRTADAPKLKSRQDLLRHLSHSSFGQLGVGLPQQAPLAASESKEQVSGPSAGAGRARGGASAAVSGVASANAEALATVAKATAAAAGECDKVDRRLEDVAAGLDRLTTARASVDEALFKAELQLTCVEAAVRDLRQHNSLKSDEGRGRDSEDWKQKLPPLLPMRLDKDRPGAGARMGGRPHVEVVVELPPIIVA